MSSNDASAVPSVLAAKTNEESEESDSVRDTAPTAQFVGPQRDVYPAPEKPLAPTSDSLVLTPTPQVAPVLASRGDVYGGITVKSEEHPQIRAETAQEVLQRSIEHWRLAKVNGVWFNVHIKDSWWVPILTQAGFVFHHAQTDYVMMTKWLPTEKANTLPRFVRTRLVDSLPRTSFRYPFTSIGVGGVVVNGKGELLLMKERKGVYLGWKFPGGAVDPGEALHEAVRREVFEETGVETEFECVLAFRQLLSYNYRGTSDIYFLCVMKPKDETRIDVVPCPHEVADCKWMSRDQIAQLPEKEFHGFHKRILERFDNWLASGRRGCYTERLEAKEFKRHWDMYYID
ncbi:Nudix hydrolase 8 [Aphelenchoides avenae]|nr:Nudix hydrolase 8 [Aphelenchus avenae]